MKRFVRIVLWAGFVLIWLAAVGLGLELYEVLRWQYVAANNPYVQSLGTAKPWPVKDIDLLDRVKATYGVQERLSYPPPDPFDAAVRRAGYFFDLSEEDRGHFCRHFAFRTIVVDEEANLLKSYPQIPEGAAPGPANKPGDTVLLEAVEPVLDTATPAFRPIDVGGVRKEALVYPVPGDGDRMAVFVPIEIPLERQPVYPEMWEIPFFVYKNGVKREGMRFSTNNVGFRDDDVQLPKPEGHWRAVCIGGSTTEEGDTNRVTYPNLVELRLRQRFQTEALDVVNCGVSGVNTRSQKLRFCDYLALDPDAIVYYVGVNDLCYLLFPGWVFQAEPWQRRLRASLFINNHFNRCLLPSEAVIAQGIEDWTLSNLRFMARYARERGIEVAVCSFAYPDPDNLDAAASAYYQYVNAHDWGGRYVTFETYCRTMRLFNTLLKDFCAEEGLLYIPVAENVTGGPEIFGDICHMKNRGIDRKAAVVSDSLGAHLGDSIRATLKSPVSAD